MQPVQVIFDCDPGKDDAFAIFLALACPQALSVVAITAVEGNVPVAFTTSNARRIVEAAGRPEIPVYRGCARPMLRPLLRKEQVQGAGGLDDSGLPPQAAPEQPEHAISALIALLESAREPLTIAAIALSAVALFYYLLILKQALVAGPVEGAAPIRVPLQAGLVLLASAIGLLLLGVFPSTVLRLFG